MTQTPDQPGQGAGEQTTGQDPKPESAARFTQDDLNRINKEERTRRQQAESELAALQAKVSKLEEANLSEQEKRVKDAMEQGRKEALESLLPQRRQDKVEAALGSKGIDPIYAPTFLQQIGGDVELDGIPAKVGELLESNDVLKGLMPATAPKPTVPGVPTPGTPPAKPLSRAEIKTMSPDEFKKRQAEINAALNQGLVK